MDTETKTTNLLETPPPLNTEAPLGGAVEGLRDEQEIEEELLNPPQSSDAQEEEQQAQMAFEEKAKLEQIVFNQTQELDQLRLQMKAISSRNQELTNQIANSTADIALKDNKYRLMETSRDDTAFKKIQSDEMAEKYKREKEERDTLVRSITREKNMLNEEIVATRERLKNVNAEKIELSADKKAWDREKREHQCELQRVRDEIAVLRESKKWLLSEINDRDNQVSQLRIDASNKEIVWQNEKNNFSTRADFLNERIVELEAELKNAEATAAEQTKEFKKALDLQEKRVFEADYELTLREKITQDYKDALNEAEGVIAELKANCERYEASIGELHEDMKNIREVVQKKEEEYESELKERSTQIAELQDELEKANELLKSRYSVGAATDEELQKIAPAAAAASQLIRSGMTLSQLYREHARVIGELEEQKVLNLQLDNEMSTIVEEIEKNAPSWKRQKEQLDRSLTHNDHLTEQLEKAADERMSLLQHKDSALRELSFTKMELERFQREHTKLREQTTHLLFVIESEARTSNGGPPLGADEQRRMYTSITGLQQKNIQLQMELENVQRDSQKRVEDAVRIESVRLREELETSKKEHENLQVAMNHLKTVMASLEQQRDRLRDLVEKGSLDPEAAQLRKENEDMKLELTSIKARYQLLENRLKELQEASTTQQRIAEDRIAQHNGRFNELQVSRASLEAELEMQRQIAAETKREFDKFMQSFYKKGEEAQKDRSALVEIEKKLLSNNEMVLQQQNKIASLEVVNRVLREDTDHARSTIARLEGELKVHQEMAKTHETLISVLGDAERRLQLGEDLKITRLESLLESTTIERDQLRVTNQNLSDQLTHASRLSSEVEKRLSGERDHLMAKLNETQTANKEVEAEIVNLRAKLDIAQKQAALYESSNVAHNPERLANRNTYLETQVEELRVQLAESDAKLKRREQELAQLSTTSDSVEVSLRQHTENSSQTISQLNSLLRKVEQRNVELMGDLAAARDELQRESENFSAREAQWNNDKTTLEQRIAITEVQLANSESVKEDTQRRLNEARGESAQDKEKVNELEQNINQLQIDRDGLEVNLEGLRSQLSHTTIELQNANARVVEEARAREAAVDAEKTRQKDTEEKIRKAEENLLVAQSRTEELIQHIANLSNELSVREAQLSGQTAEGAGVVSEGSVQSLHQVIRFLREEKEKAQERLMQAEIDEKRKAIESEELRVEKNRIAEALRQREAEAEQNKAALAQRSELITRLQKMTNIAKENTMLKAEKEKLTTAYSQLNNKAVTLNRQVAQLQEDKAKAEQNAAAATALAEARQAELEVSRKKIGETAQQKINNMMKAVEEARARAEKFAAEKDAETLKIQEAVQQAAGKDKTIKTLELKLKDTENRHQQVIALAKNLRDQRDKFKQQVDGKTPIEPVQNESMQKKQEEIQQLQEQVNDLTQKLEAEVAKAKALLEQAEEEKNEASFRSTAMSNMVKKTQDRLTSLTKELEAEKEAHARTRAEAALQQAVVQPSSSHPVELPSAPTPVISQSSVIVPSVPTPTSASGTTSTVQHMTETVPHVPSSSVTRQTDAHPTVPSASSQQSIFSPFSNQPSTFRTTPSSAVFGSTTLFQAQTSSNLLPTSSSTVTVGAPQSSSPTPSVPMVASFFGTRPATDPNRGSSSFTFASSAAPADPAPAISTFSTFATTTTTKPAISIGVESSHLSTTQPQPDSRAQEESSVVLVEEDLLPPTDGGVSQDGLLSAITSSSGEGVGGRKRTATGNETDNEVKRQRESPGEEQITSSERLHDEAEVLLDEDVSNEVLEEIPGEDEDLGDHEEEDLEGLEEEGEIEEMEEGNDDGLPEVVDNFEDDDDDIQEVPDHPLQHQRVQRQGTPSEDDIQVLSSDTDEGDGATDSEDDQGIGQMDEEQGDEEEAEDFDYGEGAEDLDDEEAAVEFVDDDGEVEVIQGIDQSDHDAGGDVDEQTQDAENVGDDLGDLGEEREAASAMEEADDEREEGEKTMRVAEDEGIAGEEESDTYSQPSQSSSTATSHAGRQAQMRRPVRTPISYDLMPTSSNESTEPQSSSSGVAAAQRRQRPPMNAGLYVTPMNRQQVTRRGGMISGRGQPQMARRGGVPGLAQRGRRGGGRGI